MICFIYLLPLKLNTSLASLYLLWESLGWCQLKLVNWRFGKIRFGKLPIAPTRLSSNWNHSTSYEHLRAEWNYLNQWIELFTLIYTRTITYYPPIQICIELNGVVECCKLSSFPFQAFGGSYIEQLSHHLTPCPEQLGIYDFLPPFRLNLAYQYQPTIQVDSSTTRKVISTE